MASIETAYENVEKLVKRFKDTSKSDRKAMNEHATRQGYIMPLFRALGWNIDDINEVSPEEKVSRGWVDFSFRIGNVPRYFLETKRADEDLNNPNWVKQAIDYAWTKSVTWALLSDFEGLRIFNAEWKTENPLNARFIEFDLDTYLTDFERLWWLSREETESKRLDREAEKWGKKTKRQSVNQHLFDNLKRWRGLLYQEYKGFNPILAASADAIVLRLLNRLIFIRTAEDREVEQVRLQSLIRELESQGRFKNLPNELSRLFREFDKTYNSELFAPHSLDGAYATPSTLKEVIEGLYGNNRTTIFNFNAIEADVLGTAYEQYLGSMVLDDNLGRVTQPSLLGDDILPVEERRKKRKSQGIYYTPAFVTKYIVQQTVGKHLAENGYNPSKPPRVLDMACGSGSFLIEAFDVIDDFVAKQRGHAQKGAVRSYDRKRQMEVLQSCIFGIDKDPQAVEVARLNLLLRALHSREKLPMLDNISYGDSLRLEHTQTFGGFDTVIGNPPYVRAENMARVDRDYYMAGNFETAFGRFDIFILFVERAIKLLKEGGRLGFILPYAGFTQNYGLRLRKFILNNCVIETIVDLSEYKVFADASVATCILVLRKESDAEKRFRHEISIIRQDTYDEGISESGRLLSQKIFVETPNNTFRLNLNNSILQLVEKIDSKSLRLGDLCYLITGAVLHNPETGESKERLISTKSKQGLKPYIEAKEIGRYKPPISTKFLDYRPDEVHRPKFKELFENEKIMIARIATEIKATIDYNHFYTDHTIDLAVRKDKLVSVKLHDGRVSEEEAKLSSQYSLSYLLGIINSKIATWYLKNMLGMALEINPETGRQLPIPRINFDDPNEKAAHNEIVKLVETMFALQKERQSLDARMEFDRARNLDREIGSVDDQINEQVSRLYKLTAEEWNLVDNDT